MRSRRHEAGRPEPGSSGEAWRRPNLPTTAHCRRGPSAAAAGSPNRAPIDIPKTLTCASSASPRSASAETASSSYRPRYLNIQRLNYLWTIRHSSARIAGNLIT